MNSTQKMFELSKQLQLLSHRYGYEVFRDAITQACYDASDETEDLDDKSLTQRYRYLANAVADASINEPEFNKNTIEE